LGHSKKKEKKRRTDEGRGKTRTICTKEKTTPEASLDLMGGLKGEVR